MLRPDAVFAPLAEGAAAGLITLITVLGVFDSSSVISYIQTTVQVSRHKEGGSRVAAVGEGGAMQYSSSPAAATRRSTRSPPPSPCPKAPEW